MARWLSRTLGLFPLVGLGLLHPAFGATDDDRPPRVALDAARMNGDHYDAPLRGGGRAKLTLSPKLQSAAHTLLVGARPTEGAVVVIDARRGTLLAYTDYSRLGRDRNVLERAVAPAASVFKLVTSTALLERTPVTPTTEVCTNGGERTIKRQHIEARGADRTLCAPFRTALGFSRNAAYAQLANRHLMRSDLLDVAEQLGFNHKTKVNGSVDIGTVEVPFNDLEFARTAAGFRGSTLSPVGAAHLSLVIASGGLWPELSLVDEAPGYEAPKQRREWARVMRSTTAHRLTRMMEVTVHSGTSRDAFSSPTGPSYLGDIRVAGKTGTLQKTRGGPTSSWFTGFAPSRNPQIVVSVLLQNGRIWHRRANEVARDVLRAHFAGHPGVTDPLEP